MNIYDIKFESDKKGIYRISVYYEYLNKFLNAFFNSDPEIVDDETDQLYEKTWFEIQNLMLTNVIFNDHYKDVNDFKPLPLNLKSRDINGLKMEWRINGIKICNKSLESINDLIEHYEITTYRLENHEYEFLGEVKEFLNKYESNGNIKEPNKNNQIDSKGKLNYIEISPFWDVIHQDIINVSRKKFEDTHYLDAVRSAYIEINSRVKKMTKNHVKGEPDGLKLMEAVFSFSKNSNPIIKLTDLSTRNEKDIQKGYGLIFQGAITAIRNPPAHENIDISEDEAIHLIFIASHLMHKLDNDKNQQDPKTAPESHALMGQLE